MNKITLNTYFVVDFFTLFTYTKLVTGGIYMVNEFEKDVQSKRNDFLDSVVGFIVPFGFFMTIFIIAQVIHFFGTN